MKLSWDFKVFILIWPYFCFNTMGYAMEAPYPLEEYKNMFFSLEAIKSYLEQEVFTNENPGIISGAFPEGTKLFRGEDNNCPLKPRKQIALYSYFHMRLEYMIPRESQWLQYFRGLHQLILEEAITPALRAERPSPTRLQSWQREYKNFLFEPLSKQAKSRDIHNFQSDNASCPVWLKPYLEDAIKKDEKARFSYLYTMMESLNVELLKFNALNEEGIIDKIPNDHRFEISLEALCGAAIGIREKIISQAQLLGLSKSCAENIYNALRTRFPGPLPEIDKTEGQFLFYVVRNDLAKLILEETASLVEFTKNKETKGEAKISIKKVNEIIQSWILENPCRSMEFIPPSLKAS